MATIPDVFIIESLRVSEERDQREGEIIYRSLRMSGKKPIYHYVRTRRELEHFIGVFKTSGYRYLHLSCHGNIDLFATTFDDLDNADMVEVLGEAIDARRLFLSTCQAATSPFARLLFRQTRCISIAGPTGEIDFDDSAVFWTAFYHLMFKANRKKMDHATVHANLARGALMIGQEFRLFSPKKGGLPAIRVFPGSLEDDDL